MILLIYTGGTIGMVKNPLTGALVPSDISAIKTFTADECLDDGVDFVSTQHSIDSSNIQKKNITELLTIVEKNYHKYSSFLVLMGTDTMAYVSALMSYCIEGLAKPIVFTGAQLPLQAVSSDGVNNLKNAIKGLKDRKFSPEVGLYFYDQWYRAVEVTKRHTTDFEAFYSPNKSNLSIDLSQRDFNVINNIKGEFMVFKVLPYQSLEVLKYILKYTHLNGLIIEAFGTGNLPDFDDELIQLFKLKITKGLHVVLISQCTKGTVSLGQYTTGLMGKNLGFVNGKKLTTESALAKMTYLYNKDLKLAEFKLFFEESLRGE